MALTSGDVLYLRRKVGASPDDATLNSIHAAYVIDKGEPFAREWVALDILERRYADYVANPSTFSVSGEYSQSTAKNIEALLKAIEDQRALMESLDIELDGLDGLPFRVVAAEAPTFVR